ncbi:MAG: alpha/beta hydrolase [Alphaproteobacteria bacterium]|nr:alpha/beta hydrolase [Alphaproteobacteria bacterium]
MAIYRQYDQAALDSQYNNRARVPDFADYFQRWDEQSAAVRSAADAALNIAYGSDPRHRLDIFPAGPRPAPTLVFIHGGYWQFLDKDHFSYLAPSFAEKGAAYVAVGYPLAPAVTLDDITASVRSALAWLWRYGREHGVDPSRLHVAGHSAGGHLAVEALATDWPAFADDLPDGLVKSATAISGLYDLEPIRVSYHNAGLHLDPAAADRNSPIHHIPGQAGPLLLAVGGEESEEFHRQQADFCAAWRGEGRPVTALELPGRNHFSVVEDLHQGDNPLFHGVCDLIWGTEERICSP